jgi:DNA polymerase III subunit beta
MIETAAVAGSALKITCSRDELNRQLATVSRAASTRTTVQVLAGVLLRSEGEKLELSATDMEISVRTPLDAEVATEGAVVVPGKLLAELARLLPGEDVSIEHRPSEGVVEVVSGAAVYRIHTYNAEDFPRLPDPAGTTMVPIDAEALRR